MLNFVICDDNELVLKRFDIMLNNIFTKYDFEAQITLKSSNTDEVLDFLKANHTDVLILDINLKANITGIELAKQVRKYNKNIYIIFTTAHLEYALLAYKIKTFDYLAKPVTQERLEETVLRLIDDVTSTPKNYLFLGNKTIIDQDEIQYIQRDGMKLVFYTQTKKYEAYSSFNKIMKTLPKNFVRCHKSFVANINNITDVDAQENIVFFGNGIECYIGPKYKNEFMEVLNDGNFTKHMASTNNAK